MSCDVPFELHRYALHGFLPVEFEFSFTGLANAPEGSFFCASCRDLSQPSSVKTPWYLSNFIKYQEVVDTTYTSEEEDDNEYQSSESGEIDIEEPGTLIGFVKWPFKFSHAR